MGVLTQKTKNFFSGQNSETQQKIIDIFGGSQAANFLKGEPSVLSTSNGKTNFQNKIQPGIDNANVNVQNANDYKSNKEDATKETDVESLLAQEGETESDKVDRLYQDNLKNQASQAEDVYKELSLAQDRSAQAQIGVLTSGWSARRNMLEKSNKSNLATWQQQFIRTGQSEYSPGMSSDFISAKEHEGIRKIQALDAQYNSAVASVNAALDEKKFSSAANLFNTIQSIKEQSLALMKENAEETDAVNKAYRDRISQVTRENAVSGLLDQGITDVASIMDYLNYSEGGSLQGDFTAKEIEDTLKILNPDKKFAGTSSDYQTYQQLKKDGEIPKDTLFLDYRRMLRNANKALTKADTTNAAMGNVADAMSEYAGSDTYVRPEDYIFYRMQAFLNDNIAPVEFDKRFQIYANPSHIQDYNLTITPAKKTTSTSTGEKDMYGNPIE